jgi:hypothetical protein
MRTLPPTEEWANVRSFGAVGDGQADDTAAIQKAIDSKRTVYLPLGFYVVNDTIRMKPDTVLIGLHPGLTQLVLPNGSPLYAGVDGPKALLESAKRRRRHRHRLRPGHRRSQQPRATALLWKAGADSLVDDIRIQGGHGTRLYDGTRRDPYQKRADFDTDRALGPPVPEHLGDRRRRRHLRPACWTPSGYAQAGFYVSNTKTPGKVYELSAEHHIRNEIVLDGVENWEFLAPQTEEEVRDGMDSVSLDIRNSKNHPDRQLPRLPRHAFDQAGRTAMRIQNSSDIRFRNVHVNGESGFATCDDNGCATYLRATKYPYENAIRTSPTSSKCASANSRSLDYQRLRSRSTARLRSAAQGQGEKLEGDFYSIAGAAVDAKGKLYFVDRTFKRIYSWSKDRGLAVVRDAPLDPINLAIDKQRRADGAVASRR